MACSMENVPHHPEVAPKIMSLQLLEEITDNFSEERKLGGGTYGNVYKGLQDGEEIAVKMLHLMPGSNELEQFKIEFENLRKLRHQNIVHLIGYCYEIKHEYVEHDGKTVFAQNIYRALCFEYLHNRSLQRHLNDEYNGLEWKTRYKIIKGACEGLKYLHEGLESPMYHLDLKPDNILLDTSMVPKLADFGLSKFVGNEQTQPADRSVGTIGYLPPEYIEKKLISKKLDIFSMGVIIIKIMTGDTGYHKCAKMSSEEFINLVHENWRNRLQANPGYTSLEADCHQVKRCIEIALDCVHADRKKRPKIGVVVNLLNATETNIPVLNKISPRSVENELLDIYPSKLCFPFELNKEIRCLLSLTNKSQDDYVYYVIQPNNPDGYSAEGLVGFVRPNFTLSISVVMKERHQPPRNEDEFPIIMINKSVRGFDSLLHSKGSPSDLASKRDDMFWEIREMGGREVSLMAVICDPNPASELISYQGGLSFNNDDSGDLTCIDVHPTQPWISTGHDKGYLSIFKGKAEACTVKFEIIHSINLGLFGYCVSVKFSPRKQWVVSGDSKGRIRVYIYFDGSEVKKFKAHGGAVRSLAVHPTRPFLLSSSDDCLIKIWDWDNGWICTREYWAHWSAVRQVTFRPMDTDTFASVSGAYGSIWPGSIKIWNINSSDPIASWVVEGNSAACFITGTDQLAIAKADKHTKIWDVESETYVHGLEEHSSTEASVVAVACHPTLPILVTGTMCGHVCLWNTTRYRLEKVFQFTDSAVQGFGFINYEGFTRLVIGYPEVIKLVKISWPLPTQ